MSDLITRLRGSRGCAKFAWRSLLFVGLISTITVLPSRVAAQALTPDQLQQLQQSRGSGNATQPPVAASQTILEPNAPANPVLPVSKLEQILSQRAGVQLRQFGYDQLGVGRSVTLPQMGAVQDDYVLGPGDELVVSLRGQENSEYRATVDRDGRVVLPRVNPLSAAGRTFGQFQKDLVNTVHKSYVSTEVFVSIGRLRQVSVLVSGEVGSPGVRTLTGLSTPTDAILISGGVKKSGSLRNIRILRGGREITVDLYSVLIGGVRSSRIALADGDKIIVPPIGATIAVAGEARRPGIYELPTGRSTISVREAAAMASGTTVPGAYSISLLRTRPDGKRLLVDVTGSTDIGLHDGEIVLIKSSVNISLNQVTLAGAVRTPGTFALGKYKTLHDLIPSADVLNPGVYMLMGIIDRIDPATLQRTAIPFSPLQVIQGREDIPLLSDDTVRLLTKREMLRLLDQSQAKGQPFAGEPPLPSENMDLPNDARAGGAISRAVEEVERSNVTDGTRLSGGNPVLGAEGGLAAKSSGNVASQNSGAVPTGTGVQGVAAGSPNGGTAANADVNGLSSTDGTFFGKALSDYWVSVNGAVHNPGTYLVAPRTTLAEVLAGIGGLVDDANLEEFEITSTVIDNASGTSTTTRSKYPATKDEFKRIVIQAFDRVEFRQVFSEKYSGSVKIDGEVRYPGVYSVLRNEKLSAVLRRAGGMTDVAFPEGVVFLRNSIAQAEEAENKRVMADMRAQLLNSLMKPTQTNSQPVGAESIKAIELLIAQLENTRALGRVPVVADLATLEKHPELDLLLEAGDNIVVPKRPSTVMVVGDVLRPGAQRYIESGSVDDYVDRSGGTTQQADTSRIIVVLPDGSVRTNSNSWLNFGFDSAIPPGSTIFVPRELDPYTTRQFVVDTIQIFSQLATTAATLAVLSLQITKQ